MSISRSSIAERDKKRSTARPAQSHRAIDNKTWRPRLSRDWIRPISKWNIVIGPVGTTLSLIYGSGPAGIALPIGADALTSIFASFC